MKAIDAILSRRSIRKYEQGIIAQEDIDLILECAMAAPSAGNQQSWHFLVIKDSNLREQISKILPNSEMLPEAALAIVVCGDRSIELYPDYWVQDCSAASENILLAAHALGYGAVWVSVYPRIDRILPVKKLLDLPESVMPLNVISIGIPNETKEVHTGLIAEKIHYDRW